MGEKEVMVACARGCGKVEMDDEKNEEKSREFTKIFDQQGGILLAKFVRESYKKMTATERKEIKNAYLGPRLFGFVNQHKVAQSDSEGSAFEEARIHLQMIQRVRVKQRHETRQKQNGIIDIKKL